MAIALTALIRVSPFTEDDRMILLSKLDHLDEDQKMQIAKTCWNILSLKYFAKLKFMIDEVLEEVREGKRKYNINDITEIEAGLNHKFADMLKYSETQEQIEEVKQQLEKFKEQKQP